jgi:hypothetical protein
MILSRPHVDGFLLPLGGRLITLNGMKVSEEISEEQSRQVCQNVAFYQRIDSCQQLLFDVDHAYARSFRSLGGGKMTDHSHHLYSTLR